MIVDRSGPGPRVAAHHRGGTGLIRVPYPIGVRTVSVVGRELVTERMVRLTIQGPGLEGFHTYQADDHVRIVFAEPDGSRRDPVPNGCQMLDWPEPMPTTRKYTVRRFDPVTRQMDLDFVLHDGGLASDWARTVALGADVVIAGPPGAKSFPHTYRHYVLAVDATALPAAARWLDGSPADVSVDLVVETDDEVEHGYPLADRDGLRVHWTVRPPDGSLLAATVDALPLPQVRTFLFAAGESGDIKPLRSWRRSEVDALVTGYWKRGFAGAEE